MIFLVLIESAGFLRASHIYEEYIGLMPFAQTDADTIVVA